MRAITRLAALGAGLVCLAGCIGNYPLQGVDRRDIGSAYTLEPQIEWAVRKVDRGEEWTVDGFTLQKVRFIKNVRAGQPLISGSDSQDRVVSYRAGMTEPEIAEIVVSGLFRGGARPEKLRPMRFGSAQGFRFDVSYVEPNGLKRSAIVAGVVLKDQLHVIVYDAAALHFFDQHKEHVERMLQSIRTN